MKRFFFLIALCACASGGSMMTSQAFYDLPIGASKNDVIETAGKPYAIYDKEDGSQEYEYIERFKVGGRETEERHYFLLIRDGKIVSKRVKQESPPPFLFDSYEMQTTEGNNS